MKRKDKIYCAIANFEVQIENISSRDEAINSLESQQLDLLTKEHLNLE